LVSFLGFLVVEFSHDLSSDDDDESLPSLLDTFFLSFSPFASVEVESRFFLFRSVFSGLSDDDLSFADTCESDEALGSLRVRFLPLSVFFSDFLSFGGDTRRLSGDADLLFSDSEESDEEFLSVRFLFNMGFDFFFDFVPSWALGWLSSALESLLLQKIQ